MRVPAEPALRAAYAAESAALGWQATRTASVLAITLVPLFAVLDRVVFPAHAGLFLQLRVGCVGIVGLILCGLHTSWGRRHGLGLGVLVTTTAGLMIDAMTMLTGAETSPYYAGTSLVLLAVALLMPWPPSWTLGTSVLLVSAYVAPVIAAGRVDNARMLVNNLFFLLSTALIAVISTALRERLRWREFTNRAALVEVLRHKSDFMARMSHELRTPIHVMIGYADILLDDALAAGGAEARRLVERIHEHGVLLHRLISDLLDYAKVEAGKMEVHAAPLRVAELLEHTADRFRPLAERKGLVLRTRPAPDLPALVTDRQRLDQILTNLVGNAIKFTERGGITLVARAVREDDGTGFVDLAPADVLDVVDASALPGLVILVEDTGIGIRAADLARLAADFEQVDEGAAAKYGGTGLGLSISRKLARCLGGRIAVQSRHGKGSVFAVFLPVATAAPAEAAQPPAASPSPRAAVGV